MNERQKLILWYVHQEAPFIYKLFLKWIFEYLLSIAQSLPSALPFTYLETFFSWVASNAPFSAGAFSHLLISCLGKNVVALGPPHPQPPGISPLQSAHFVHD